MKTIFANNNYYVLSDDGSRISDALESKMMADEFMRWLESANPEATDAAVLMEMFKRNRNQKSAARKKSAQQKETEDGGSATEYSAPRTVPTTMNTKAPLTSDGGMTVNQATYGGLSNA